MTDTRPGGREPYSWQQVMMDTLNRIESRMLTRDEFAAHQQRFDNSLSEMRTRIDEVQTRALTATSEWRAESIAEHKEFRTELDSMKAELTEERKFKQRDESKRRFTIAMSVFAGALSVVTGVAVFILQGVIGG